MKSRICTLFSFVMFFVSSATYAEMQFPSKEARPFPGFYCSLMRTPGSYEEYEAVSLSPEDITVKNLNSCIKKLPHKFHERQKTLSLSVEIYKVVDLGDTQCVLAKPHNLPPRYLYRFVLPKHLTEEKIKDCFDKLKLAPNLAEKPQFQILPVPAQSQDA